MAHWVSNLSWAVIMMPNLERITSAFPQGPFEYAIWIHELQQNFVVKSFQRSKIPPSPLFGSLASSERALEEILGVQNVFLHFSLLKKCLGETIWEKTIKILITYGVSKYLIYETIIIPISMLFLWIFSWEYVEDLCCIMKTKVRGMHSIM